MKDKLIHAKKQVDERTGRQTDMTKLLGAFGEYSNVPESHERPAIMKSFC
jgi:hypothetical protein